MKTIIQEISPAIISSRKIQVRLSNGKKMVVHPHVVVKKKEGNEILKSMLETGDCMDIPIENIAGVSILPQNFALDSTCLNFDHREYDLVFPKRADWFESNYR